MYHADSHRNSCGLLGDIDKLRDAHAPIEGVYKTVSEDKATSRYRCFDNIPVNLSYIHVYAKSFLLENYNNMRSYVAYLEGWMVVAIFGLNKSPRNEKLYIKI